MKIIIGSLLLALTTPGSFAQRVHKDKFTFGVGIDGAIPAFNLDLSKVGGGADAILRYRLSGKAGITADLAVIALPGKGRYPSTAIVPIRLGVQYFLLPTIYAGAKAGLGVYTILKASANHFAYTFNGGYIISKHFEAALMYDGYSNKHSSFGYAGLRLGYNF